MDQEHKKDSANDSDMERSGWSDLCDSSLLQMLDEPFDIEKDTSQLRSDEKYCGFDENTGSTWIYPTNFPIRSYQLNIAKAALFKNTLVVLPTGLGKTFIAAVVMYNIYRWYPTGKVVFMAPTRPLVTQQIEACRKIMGITFSDTAEMTGHQNKKVRRDLWKTKRVFFATPQVVQSDINDVEQEFPFSSIKLLVVDEAHKAKGRYAYTEVVQSIAARNIYFRVLALSATPGRHVEDVVEVVRNLLISHLEIRWENCIDVSTYTHKKHIKIISVAPGKDLTAIRNEFIDIIDPYIRFLVDNNILTGNVSNMTRGRLIMEQKRFREMCMRERHPNQSAANTNFSICVSLFHALELLERHGTRVFLNFFDDTSNPTEGTNYNEKFFVALNPALKAFLEKLRNYVGPSPFSNCDLSMTLGRFPEVPQEFDFGHPKYEIAKNFLLDHFKKDKESRAIVFCEYRESVLLLYHLFQQNTPLIKSRIFVGQGGTGAIRAVTQKEQIEVMNDFRKGACNTLIATSVAEEGIDVGEVDLIICFDISTRNPTRFTQRIGRTGRKKQGTVIMLTTEGKEYSVAKEVLATKDKTNQKIAKNVEVTRMLYVNSPRLVPPEYDPKCQETKMEITEEEIVPQKGRRRSKANQTNGAENQRKRRRKSLDNDNHGSDVRKYFKKLEPVEAKDSFDLSGNDRSIPLDEAGASGLENTSAFMQEEASTNGPQKGILEKTRKRLSRKINALSKRLTKSIPKTETSPKSVITSNSSSHWLKKLVLEKNPEYVQEKYEAMKALKAVNEAESNLGQDAICLMNEYAAIEKVLGSQSDIELFLKTKRKEKNYLDLDTKFAKLFEGLQDRDFDDDVSSFIDEQLNGFKEEEPDSKLDECRTAFDSYHENYLTQNVASPSLNKATIFESEVKAQSTPFRKMDVSSPCRKSSLNKRLGNLFNSHKYAETATSTTEATSNLVLPLSFATAKDFNQSSKFAKADELNENLLFADDLESFEAVHNNSRDFQKLQSNSQGAKNDQNTAKRNAKIENVGKQFHKETDDLFDDDFDEIIASTDIITQIEKKTESPPMITGSVPKNSKLIVDNEKQELNRSKISNAELDDFDLNDFLEPFDAEMDEDLPLTQQQVVGYIKNAEHCSHPLRAYNKPDNSSPKIATIAKSPQTPSIATSAKSLAGTSPSLFSKPPNLAKLKLFSLSGKSRAKAKDEVKENQEMHAAADIPNCSQYDHSQAINESLIRVPRMKRRNRAIASSESEDEEPTTNSTPPKLVKTARGNRREKKKRHCEFLDDEAMVSGDDSSEGEFTYDDGMSQFVVDSIIADEEEGDDNSTINMRAKYLESVRSPKRFGQFKIPEPRNFMDMSKICSQPVLDESMSAYKEDSFVVTDEENLSDEEISQLCPLEQAEAILKAKRRAKRKGVPFKNTEIKAKLNRWKNLKQFSDSSDEES